MGIDLPLIWAGIIAFGGHDVRRAGRLRPRHRHPVPVAVTDRDDRDVMMNTVAPVWDGNETWLVLGGAGLFAAFPLAYAVILPALYLPLMLMLVGLIFRGVAFEFRFKADAQHAPLLGQGLRLRLDHRDLRPGRGARRLHPGLRGRRTAPIAGGALDWLTPFRVFTGLGAGRRPMRCSAAPG